MAFFGLLILISSLLLSTVGLNEKSGSKTYGDLKLTSFRPDQTTTFLPHIFAVGSKSLRWQTSPGPKSTTGHTHLPASQHSNDLKDSAESEQSSPMMEAKVLKDEAGNRHSPAEANWKTAKKESQRKAHQEDNSRLNKMAKRQVEATGGVLSVSGDEQDCMESKNDKVSKVHHTQIGVKLGEDGAISHAVSLRTARYVDLEGPQVHQDGRASEGFWLSQDAKSEFESGWGEKSLIKDLLADYDRRSRPVVDGLTPRVQVNRNETAEQLTVEFGLGLIQILELNEMDQVLTTSVRSLYVSHCVVSKVCVCLCNLMFHYE
ncbi:unnamed protein product [Protopolystoma xenopodis]|uniref:Neurotransmitter-gated ion-channel ligand-binding domain-containing protein n=1 Tax=Protopolystoma xenopodis TaxID=117903 RepID=A0A448WLM5_9PLAT|nr:unnamed protein product [Protopolystoma xenopodis]